MAILLSADESKPDIFVVGHKSRLSWIAEKNCLEAQYNYPSACICVADWIGKISLSVDYDRLGLRNGRPLTDSPHIPYWFLNRSQHSVNYSSDMAAYTAQSMSTGIRGPKTPL